MGKRAHWKGGRPAAPSIEQVDPLGWIRASLAAWIAVAMGALALSWRTLPLVGAPPWPLPDLLGCAGSALAHGALPALLGDRARECAAGWAAMPSSQHAGAVLRLAFAAVAGCLPAILSYRGFMQPRDALIHLRGARRYEGKEAVAEMRRKFAKARALRPDHDIAPGVPYPGGAWSNHVLVAAGTGGGKSTFVKALLGKVVEAGEPLLLFDPKGDFAAFYEIPFLAPWDARSHAWDVGKDMRNFADMRRFAESVVQPSTDPMWADAARMLLVGSMAGLRDRLGDDWGFAELAEAVSERQPALALTMARSHPEAERLVDKPTVTTQGILINLAAACAPIHDLAKAWGHVPPDRRVSFVDWALGKGRHKQIILQGHASYGALLRGFARPIVETVAMLVSSPEMADDHVGKRWFVCDELPALGKVDVRLLFAQGRSRGFRCVAAFQDAAQLEEVHGPLMVKALTSMVGATVVGRFGPGETAELVSKAMGAREVERPNVSAPLSGGGGSTVSYAREQIPLYLPSELSSRLGINSRNDGVALSVLAGGDAHELFWPLDRAVARRELHVPAEWTKGSRGSGRAAAMDGGQAAAANLAEPGQDPLEWLHALDGAAEAMGLDEWVESQEPAPAAEQAMAPIEEAGPILGGEAGGPLAEPLPMLDGAAFGHAVHAGASGAAGLAAQAVLAAGALLDAAPGAEPPRPREVRKAPGPANPGDGRKPVRRARGRPCAFPPGPRGSAHRRGGGMARDGCKDGGGDQMFDFPRLFGAEAPRGRGLSVEFRLDGDVDGQGFPRVLGRMPLSAKEWRRHCELFRDVDRRRFMLAEALVEAKRACLAMAEWMERAGSGGADKPSEPFRKLWDDMEREESKPKKGWEPETVDPASPEANPEIADLAETWNPEGGEPGPEPEPEPPKGMGRAVRRIFRK